MTQGVITLHVEVQKPLGRKKLIQVDLTWEDMLDLPISTDELTIDRYTVTVVQGPRSDEELLDRPRLAVDPKSGPIHWTCRYDGEWVRVENLIQQLKKDPRVQFARAVA